MRAVEKVDDAIQYEKIDGDGGVKRIDLFDASVFSCCQMLKELERKSRANEWFGEEKKHE